MTTVLDERLSSLPLTRACSTLGLNRSTVYAHQQRAANDEPPKRCRQNSAQPNALTTDERKTVVRTLNGERFIDQSPKEVDQRLLESGQYLFIIVLLKSIFCIICWINEHALSLTRIKRN